jgi:hypothetical protein
LFLISGIEILIAAYAAQAPAQIFGKTWHRVRTTLNSSSNAQEAGIKSIDLRHLLTIINSQLIPADLAVIITLPE